MSGGTQVPERVVVVDWNGVIVDEGVFLAETVEGFAVSGKKGPKVYGGTFSIHEAESNEAKKKGSGEASKAPTLGVTPEALRKKVVPVGEIDSGQLEQLLGDVSDVLSRGLRRIGVEESKVLNLIQSSIKFIDDLISKDSE